MAEQKKKGHLWRNLIIGFGVLLIVALLIIWLAPLMSAAYDVNVPYQVQVEKDLTYIVSNSSASGSWDLSRGCYAQASVTLLNTDASPGTFAISFTFPTLNRTYTDSDIGYIFPGQSKTLTGIADTDCGEDWNWRYDVTPGTKMVTENRERIETHYKQVSILDYLLNY